MHSDWFNGIEILQGRWQQGEKVGYCCPSGLEKTLCKWDIYVSLVTKGLIMCAVSENVYRTQVYAVINEEGITASSEIICICGNSI